MLAAALLAASLIAGPELPVPAAIDEPVKVDPWGPRKIDVARAGNDFALAWYAGHAVWSQRIDGTSGAPLSRTAEREAIVDEVVYPRVASNGLTTRVIWKDEPPAITAVGDAFLEVWNEGGGTVGEFIGGPRFTIDTVPHAQLAAASNGIDALVIAGGRVHRVTRGGTVTSTTSLGFIDDPQLVWDGSAYLAAYNSATKFYLAAFDANGALLRPPLAIANSAADDFAIASNGNGSIIFTNGFDAIIRIAPGGAAIESRDRQPYPFYELFGAASNGVGYLIATSFYDEIDVSYDFAPPLSAALEHTNQLSADIVAAGHGFFIGTEERERDVVMSFDGQTFHDPRSLPRGTIILGGDGDRAAALIVGDAVYGTVLGEDAPPIRLGSVSTGPSFTMANAVTPVADTFLAFWTINSPTQPGALERVSTIYVTPFDSEPRPFARGTVVSVVPHGDFATVVYIDDGVARSVNVDRTGRMISPAMMLDDDDAMTRSDVRIATGSAGTAIVYTREAPELGDAGTRAFVQFVDAALRRRGLR